MSWAFASLLARLPDDDHLVLELGDSSGFAFPREVGRVVIVQPGHEMAAESSKIRYVEGDISHVPTVLNAARYALDTFGDRAILLLSVGGMDALDPLDAHELRELLLSGQGPCAAAILETSHKPIWRFTGDPTGEGLVSMIQDHKSKIGRRESWWLYMRPDDQDERKRDEHDR